MDWLWGQMASLTFPNRLELGSEVDASGWVACPSHLGSGRFCAGYVAIGFTDVMGKMGPADVYVLFVDDGGVARCVDSTTGATYNMFPPDPEQNCVALSGIVSNGTLNMTFSRLLDTGVCRLSASFMRCLLPVGGC